MENYQSRILVYHGLYLILQSCVSTHTREKSNEILPSNLELIAACIGASKIERSLHTSSTLRSLFWSSTGAPLYAMATASAMMGANAVMKSSLCRILDC